MFGALSGPSCPPCIESSAAEQAADCSGSQGWNEGFNVGVSSLSVLLSMG